MTKMASLRRPFVHTGMLIAFLILFLMLPIRRALAQIGDAAISGRIMDQQSAVIPDVEVEIKNVDTGLTYTTKTNKEGIYSFPSLPPGRYLMNVRKEQFRTVSVTGIGLHTQDDLSRNFVLQVGSSAVSITVNATNEHMATDTSAVGVLVNRDFVENMPLNGRSFQDLIALAPGAVSSSDGSGLFAINGQRTNANYYVVDGVSANIDPGVGGSPGSSTAGTIPSQTILGTTQSLASVDALQEFKIQTSGYTAEYGRQPGGQIELTTRSGTNVIHGSLFDYFRNTVLDANDWFLNQQGLPNPGERQNDFGGTLGGALRIPKVYDGKDKTFYFVSYEGLRLTQPQFSGILDVPTVAFRQFAAPAVQPFLNALPLPTGPENADQCALPQTFSCTAQWSAGFSNPSSLDSISLRVDQFVGERFRLFVHYSDTPSSLHAQTAGQISSITLNTHSWTIGSTATLSFSLLNELRFNYSASGGGQAFSPTAFGGAVPYPKSVVIPPQYVPGNTLADGGVNVFVPMSNFFNIPIYDDAVSRQHQYNLLDSVSWTHGSHSLKFGADFRRLLPLYNPEQYRNVFELLSISAVQQGFATEDFVFARHAAHPTFTNLSLYAQDHWKLTPRLTIDYGLRWEFNPAPGASDGKYPLALTTGNLATAQLAPQGTAQYRATYSNFAPRVGFAYQIHDSQIHPVVLRGGFGIFYNTGQAEGAAGYAGYPFSALNRQSNISLPAPASALAPPSLDFPLIAPYGLLLVNDPNLKLPYTQQWNLTLDKGLSSKNTLSISYVGNSGKKLLLAEYHPDLSSINPQFTQMTFTSNFASSTYNALQIQDQGYILPGMQLIASFTWAHAIDNASTDNNGNAPLRGNSDNDVRQVFNLALNYQIPGAGSNKFLRILTQRWSADSRLSAQSGYPVDVNQGFYTLADGSEQLILPDLVPGVPLYLHNVRGVLGGWALNPAAFSLVPTDPNTGAPLRQGDLGRNFVHGPNFWSLNVALQRNFPIHERLHLSFRAEAFNVLNHPNAGGIDSCLCDSTFGESNPGNTHGGSPTIGAPNQLYGTGAARSLQLMLKLQF